MKRIKMTVGLCTVVAFAMGAATAVVPATAAAATHCVKPTSATNWGWANPACSGAKTVSPTNEYCHELEKKNESGLVTTCEQPRTPCIHKAAAAWGFKEIGPPPAEECQDHSVNAAFERVYTGGHYCAVGEENETAEICAGPNEESTTEPHFFVNGSGAGSREVEGVQIPWVSWGTLTLEGASGATVTCHNVIGGFNENPKGTSPEVKEKGPAGIDETVSFNPYSCESAQCTAAATGGGPFTYISVEALPAPYVDLLEPGGNAINLGWKSHLENSATTANGSGIRDVSEKVSIRTNCHVQVDGEPIPNETGPPTYLEVKELSTGENAPETSLYRGTATSPGGVIWDAGSGGLIGPSGEGKTHGEVHTLGYLLAKQIMNAKKG